jgi:two-component system response regulator YesN
MKDAAIKMAIQVIHERYWDTMSQEKLANEVGISKYKLSRRFRAVVGMTFRSYLVQVRLEKAKLLLTTGTDTITTIAQEVGFGDLPRLDKLFKRDTGITPSAYREKNVKG